MPLDDDDIRRIGDMVEIRTLKAFNEHRTSAHDPLERRVNKLQRVTYGFQVLWSTIAGFFALGGGK